MDGVGRTRVLLLRGYGPVVALVLVFGLVVLLVPGDEVGGALAESPRDDAGAPGADGAAPAPDDADDPGAAEATSAAGPVEDGGAVSEQAGAGGDADGPDAGQRAQATAEQDAARVRACDDRDLQVPGDPYSPPCVVSSGDNPGATHRGVSADEIVISARTPDEPGFLDELANLADADIADSQQDVRRTIDALAEYFNERFEFHGRRLRFEFFDGQGNFQEEAQGRGHEQAQQDALTVAEELGAFGELTGSTEPFADALAQEGVLSFAGIHFPRGYHVERRPYNWSTFTDCSSVVEAAAEWTVQRLYGRKAAFAGDPAFRERVRDVVAIGPENPVYQACVDDAQRVYDAHGEPIPDLINYRLDIPTMSNQAANIIARLQERGVTTVQAFVDPVMAVFLTARAQEQGYEPEWVISGAAYIDQDVLGQLQEQEQWSRTFGISFAGQTQHQQQSLGYHAYKQIRDDEPAVAVDAIYGAMYLIAIGVQGAGPELTPDTFEQGMFDYPGGTGPMGTWGFGPENYTATEDFREIYYDPEAISVYNNEPGAYIETDPGERLAPGTVPEGPPRLP